MIAVAMRVLLAVVLLLGTLVVSPAGASERSIVATSEGLMLFHQQRYAEARTWFDRAVAEDADDTSALYYRGVTLGRLGAYEQASTDLQRVLALRPEMDQAALELGIVLVRAGRHAEALSWLARAGRSPELAAGAAFYSGLAELRLEHAAAALGLFQRAESDPHLRRAARYYQGLIHYRAERWNEAAAQFDAVEAPDPQSEIGQEAQRFQAAIRDRGGRAWHLYGSAGFEYDSNVVLAPSSDDSKDVLAISDQDDGRATLLVGGQYVPWRTDHFQVALGYEFYQSLHFDLTEFNVQDHRPSLDLSASFGRFDLGLASRYDYYRLDSDSFINQWSTLPWLRYAEGSFGHVEVYYRMRRRDFFERRFSDRLDGFNHAVAVTQTFDLGTPERAVWVGYRFDRQDDTGSGGDAFSYDGNQVDTGLTWLFPAPALTATLAYHYRHEAYDHASHGSHDHEHGMSFSLAKKLTKELSVRIGYDGTFNLSNVDLFQYTRHIGGIALDVSF